MSANDSGTAEALCAQWMPRKKTTCARTPGHGGSCMTGENMARRREYRRNYPHPESSESRKKSNRKYRISSYGLSQEQFDGLLDAQQHTCAKLRRTKSAPMTAPADRPRASGGGYARQPAGAGASAGRPACGRSARRAGQALRAPAARRRCAGTCHRSP
jgi:hypothetical protein